VTVHPEGSLALSPPPSSLSSDSNYNHDSYVLFDRDFRSAAEFGGSYH
jgi:hypothetical protein